MSAQDYPVTFPYGATSPPYGTAAQPYHRGDDRAMPVGTPVVVNGLQIGLSGSTGESTGPHLHVGRFVNGKDTNPNGSGFTLPRALVYDTGYDATNGNYVRILSDDVVWVYLHLSAINVSTGQTVEGESMTKTEAYTVTDGFYYWGTDAPPTPEQSEYWAQRMVDLGAPAVQELHDAMKKQAASSGSSAGTDTQYVQIPGPVFQIKKG